MWSSDGKMRLSERKDKLRETKAGMRDIGIAEEFHHSNLL